jgi:hypothetical protein
MTRPVAVPPPIPPRGARGGERPAPPAPPRPPATGAGVPPQASALVDHAYESLRRLAAAKPLADAATRAAEQIERTHLAAPFTVAIAGEPGARAAFLDFLAGGQLFDPARQAPAGMVMSVRRGAATMCRARHRDGSVEELRMPVAGAAPEDDDARRAISEWEGAAAQAREQLPELLRVRPPWWAIWAWVMRWFLARRHRAELVALAQRNDALAEARRQLEAGVSDAGAAFDESRRRFAETVRSLADARGRGASVERLFIEVAGGPLPADVVVLELPPTAGADSLEHAGVDACLVVGGVSAAVLEVPLVRAALSERQRVYFTGDPATGDKHAGLRPLGGVAPACAALGSLLAGERALRLGRLAADTLRRGRRTLDDQLERSEKDFADRIARLELQRIADPEAYVALRAERVRPLVVERVHQLMEQATVEVAAEIERLAGGWTARLQAAQTTDELRSAAAAIDEESAAAVQSARLDGRRLLALGIAGSAHDLYPMLLADLPERAATAAEPVPAPLEVLPDDSDAGTKLGPAAPWLRSLFRSTEKTRAAVLERLGERMVKLKQVTAADVLDAEPRLVHALAEPLIAGLRAAVDRHGRKLEQALAAEREEILQERARLEPVARARDTAAADHRRLTELMNVLAG